MRPKNFLKILGCGSVGLGVIYSNSLDTKKKFNFSHGEENKESERLLNVILISRHGVKVGLNKFELNNLDSKAIFFTKGSYAITRY